MKNPSEDEIYKKFAPKIRMILSRNSGVRKEDYEDIVDETIKRTIEAIRNGTFRKESKLGTFVYSVCKNVIYSYLHERERDEKIIEKAKLRMPSVTLAGGASDPIERIHSNELKEILDGYLDELKDVERKVIVLFYYSQLEIEEIAERLHIDNQKVYNIKFYALKKLRKMIGKKNLSEFQI